VPASDDSADGLIRGAERPGFCRAWPRSEFLHRRFGGRLGPAHLGRRRRFQKLPDVRMGGEEAFDALPQVAVIATSGPDIGNSLVGRTFFEGGEKDGFGGRLFGHDEDSDDSIAVSLQCEKTVRAPS
jgi:hypothetical protein